MVEEDLSGKQESRKEEDEVPEAHKAQWPTEYKARIDKLTAQREAARLEAKAEKQAKAELEAENADLKARATQTPTLAPTPANPLAHVQTIQQLRATEAELEKWLEWSRLNPNGATDVVVGKDEKGNEITQDFDAAEVAKLHNDLDRTLRKAIPQRETYLQTRAQQDAIAKADYPELFNEESEDYQLGRMVLEQMPDLLRFPDALLNVGIYVDGLKAYRARKQEKISQESRNAGKNGEKVNPAVAAFTRPQPTRAPKLPNVQRPSTNGEARPDQEVEDAEKRAVESGGRGEAMTDLVRSLRSAQRNNRGGQRLVA
jgi:hypothetical protein